MISEIKIGTRVTYRDQANEEGEVTRASRSGHTTLYYVEWDNPNTGTWADGWFVEDELALIGLDD